MAGHGPNLPTAQLFEAPKWGPGLLPPPTLPLLTFVRLENGVLAASYGANDPYADCPRADATGGPGAPPAASERRANHGAGRARADKTDYFLHASAAFWI